MRRLTEQWLTARPGVRIATWLFVMVLVSGVVWLLGIQPGRLALDKQRRDHAATVQAVALQQQASLALTAKLALAQRNLPSLTVTRFSPASLGETSGLALVTWQPQGEEAELVVRGQWRDIPELFYALAATDARLKGFTVTPFDGALMLTLRLEGAYESQ